MKKSIFFSFLFFILGMTTGISQEYLELIQNPKANTTLQEVQQKAEAYFATRDKGRGSGYKQYKRWEYKMQRQVNADGKIKKNFNGLIWQASQRLKGSSLTDHGSRMPGAWTNLGPMSYSNGPQGYNGGLGRVNVIAFHPTDANTIYLGTPAGGLWKTTDGATTWTPMSDDLASIGVSGIAVDHSTPNTVYILTGDGDGGDTFSTGVLRSTDGGSTWATTGLSWGVTSFVRGYKLLMHPTDSDTMFAVTSSGILKTTDGWTTWSTVQAGSFRDIEFKPGDPTTVYAVTTSTFYRSTDTGSTWSIVSTGLPTGENRVALAVSPANSSYVYYLAGPGGASGGGTYNGMYRSTDSGLTFSTRSTTPNILGNSDTGSGTSDQSWYDLAMAVSPTNAEVTITGGVNIWRSTDGGTTNSLIAHWYSPSASQYVHADIHDLVYNPVDNALYSGTDGGISRSTDNGVTWTNIWNGLEIMQFYRIAGLESNQDYIIGGAQDNGSNKYTGTTDIQHIVGGDGMDCMVNYNDQNNIYYSFQNGGLQRSTNGGTTRTGIQPAGSIGAWVTPYAMDATNPSIIYGGYNDVYRSTNMGTTWTNLGSDGRGAFAVGVNDPARLYASNGSLIQTSANTGGSWTTISAGLPGLTITFIAVDPDDASNVWVTLGGYTAGEKVYESTDAGATWTNVSGALPNIPALSIAYQDTGGAPADAIYVGMAIGVYYMSDVTPWTLHETGLPNVPIYDLEINHTNNKIRAGTYGRGLWEAALFGPAAPVNDLCTDALSMNCGDTVSGDTTMATFDSVGTCGTSNTAPGVWYSFTAISNSATLSTCNQASYDTKISVFSGSCGSLVCVGGQDDAAGCSGFTTELTVATVPGTTYLVLVHGFGAAVGTFDLTLTCAPPGPANDLCVNADPITCGQTLSGDTTSATIDGAPFCGTSNTAPGVWYTFTGIDGITNLSTCNQAAYDTKISVYSGTCGTLICEAGQDDAAGCAGFTTNLDVCTQAGVTYYVLVHGFGSAVGTFDLTMTCTPLNVSLTCPPTINQEGCSAADAPPAYANFTEFQNAGGSTVDGDTTTFTLINEVSSGGFPVTITRTYEITDTCGNTATCDHVIIVDDTTDPVIACPADVIANTDAGICGAVVTYTDASAIDACGIASVVQTSPDPNVLGSGDLFPVGTTTITFTATDNNGNTSTCSFDIIVTDNEDPVIACQDITVELDANGDYNLTPGEALASSSDNCGIATIEFADPNASDVTECGPNGLPIPATGTSGPMDPSPAVVTTVGTVGVDYAIDRVDLDLNHTFDGDLNISLTSPNGLILDLSSGNGGSGDNYTNTVFMDGFPSITTGSAPFTGTFEPEGGPMNAFFAGEPVNGNWTLNIFDNFGGDSGVLNNYCITFASLAPATVPSIDLTCADVGTNTFTVVVTDVNGNTSTCETEVTVEDNIAPVLICIGEPATVVDATSDSPGLAIVDNTTVSTTMTVADDFVITDLDVDLNITHTWVGDLQITLESPAGTQVLIFDGGSDGCSGDNIVDRYDDESANPLVCNTGADAFPLADYMPSNALSAFDGESTLGDWIISIQDTAGGDTGTLNSWTLNYSHDVTSAPYDAILDGTTGTVTVNAADLLLSVDEACGYSVSFGAGGSPINECGDGLPAAIDENLPPTESTATVAESGVLGTDYALDTVTLDITHTFDGDLDIELISPAGTVLMLSDQNGGGGDNYTGTVFQDGGSDITLGTPPFTGTFEPQGGTFAATFDGEDVNGGWVLRVTDNFGGDVGTLDSYCINFVPLSSTTMEFDCSQLGLNEVEVTVTDDSGNSSSCTATVNVIDNTDPILVCMDATVELDENGMAEVTPDLFIDTANSFDACGITITAVDVTDVTCDDIGTAITVTVFASDASGNLASCTATLTVVDLLGPAIEGCPADQTVDPGPLNLFYELPDYWALGGITAVDNCTDPVTDFSQTPAAGTLLPDGVYTISICATDEYGNEGCCTFELTIESVLGKDDNLLDISTIVIYPNPAKSIVNISNPKAIPLESATIYDLTGKLVRVYDLKDMGTEKTLDVSFLASATYLVYIQSENGTITKQLLKE